MKMNKDIISVPAQFDDASKLGGGVKRIRWIDEVRGFAIIMVIIGHVIGGLGCEIGGGEDNILRTIIYSFHMPLMFIISGLVAHENKYGGLKNFLSQILRLFIVLYIPYLLWGYLFWAVKYFVYVGNAEVNLQQGLELFWNYSAWIPGWYLLTLLAIKILDLCIDALIKNPVVKIAIWCVLFIMGGFFANVYLLSRILRFGIFYQIGKAIKNEEFQRSRIFTCQNCIILLCVASICRFSNHLNYIMDFSIAVSVSERHSKVLETLGGGSMAPYVLHAYMTIPVRIILQKCGCRDFAMYVILETTAAVLCSLIVIKIMERVRWIKAFFYPTVLLKRR